MSTVHMTIGSLVIVGYVVSLLLNVRTLSTGKEFSWQKMVSFAAAGLLVVQYTLGFSLLGEENDIPGTHYLLALAALIPVGFEHMVAQQKTNPVDRGKFGTIANAVTVILVLVAYQIGQSNS